MTATEMLTNGFKAIECEKQAREKLGQDPLNGMDIVDRLKRIGEDIRRETGINFDYPEIGKLYKSYVGVNL